MTTLKSRRQTAKRSCMTAVVTSVLAAGVLLSADGANARPVESTFSFVADHHAAAAQPTSQGRILAELSVHEGRIFAGYGDYQDNTGPISIEYLDESSRSFAHAFTSDTEAVYNLKALGGKLVVPAIDPRSKADFAIDGPWRDARPFKATHVFDAATLTGADMWMVGSQGDDAVAWRSTDGGASWGESLRLPRIDGGFARFYFAAVANDRLYVQAVSSMGGPFPTSKIFDGREWHDGPSILDRKDRGWGAKSFGSGFAYHSEGHARVGAVRFFDGVSTTTLERRAFDVEVTDTHVWMLTASGDVVRSHDLTAWETVARAPATARSLAVDGDQLYVGTADSQLWHAAVEDLPLQDASNGRGIRGSSREIGRHGLSVPPAAVPIPPKR